MDTSQTCTPNRKPLSVVYGLLIAFGLFGFACIAGILGGGSLVLLAVVVTSGWAAIDSAKIGLGRYKTVLASHPLVLFFGMVIFWVVLFSWYLVVRSQILAGKLETRERPTLGLLVLVPGVLLIIVSTVFFLAMSGMHVYIRTANPPAVEMQFPV